MTDPLFIFLDLEAAHGNNYFGDIIEIAAKVDPRVLENETFSSFINTKQNLSYFGKFTLTFDYCINFVSNIIHI